MNTSKPKSKSKAKSKPVWSVTVGNIGTTYTGNGTEAKRVFADYREQSESNVGRAAG